MSSNGRSITHMFADPDRADRADVHDRADEPLRPLDLALTREQILANYRPVQKQVAMGDVIQSVRAFTFDLARIETAAVRVAVTADARARVEQVC